METIFSPHSVSPLFNIKASASSSKPTLSPSLQPKSNSQFYYRPITSSLKKEQPLSPKPSLPPCTSWLAHAQQGLAALAISLALNFSPLLHSGNVALASEFDVLNEGPPKDSYVVDDAGVLSKVTRSDLKQLLSDLETRKNFHINFITVRKLTSKADAFEYADQVLERWYPSVEEGNNKGIVVLVTSQKEGAVTGGPAFVQAVGENILDATVSENLPDCINYSSSTPQTHFRLDWRSPRGASRQLPSGSSARRFSGNELMFRRRAVEDTATPQQHTARGLEEPPWSVARAPSASSARPFAGDGANVQAEGC